MTRLLTTGLLIAIAIAIATTATAQTSPITISPDGQFTIVQKNIEDQRWAIVQDRSNRTVTGNVFFLGGGPAQFVWCDWIGETNYRCSGTSGCTSQPCSWASIGTISLPDSFFTVPGGGPEPTPQPTPPASGLQALIGTWDATFRIGTTFSYRYRLQEVRQATNGNYSILVGRDEQNDIVLLARTRDLSPGTPTSYEYFVLETDSLLCEAYLFNQTGTDRLEGSHSSLTVVNGECDEVLGEQAATAIRVSRSAATADTARALGRAVRQQKRSARGQSRAASGASAVPVDLLRALAGELRATLDGQAGGR